MRWDGEALDRGDAMLSDWNDVPDRLVVLWSRHIRLLPFRIWSYTSKAISTSCDVSPIRRNGFTPFVARNSTVRYTAGAMSTRGIWVRDMS